jgi:hypothetical protein
MMDPEPQAADAKVLAHFLVSLERSSVMKRTTPGVTSWLR